MRSLFKYGYLLLLALLVAACISDTDDNANNTPQDPLNGFWNLSNLSGGFAGININYQPGDVVWNFNTDAMVITVENNVDITGPESAFLPMQNGNYSYSITEMGGNSFLSIDGVQVFENGEFGKIEFSIEGDLIIDQHQSSAGEAADVYVLSFAR